jgi:hypothetical protein
MRYMFYGATSFDQTLCWDTSKASTTNMFVGSNGEFSTIPYPGCL